MSERNERPSTDEGQKRFDKGQLVQSAVRRPQSVGAALRRPLTPEERLRLNAGAGLVLVLFIYLAAGITYVEFNRLNIDEGWLLYAGKLVREGQRPYVDFVYSQPPLQPYLYGLARGYESLRRGRMVSLLCGELCILAILLAAWKLRGPRAGLLAGLLLGLDPFGLSMFTLVKSYAPVSLFFALAWLALAADPNRRRNHVVATVCLVLAAGVRNTAIAGLAGLVLYLALFRRDRRDLLATVLLTAVLGLGLMVGPFLIWDREAFVYDTFTFFQQSYRPRLDVILWGLFANLVTLSRSSHALAVFFLTGLVLYLSERVKVRRGMGDEGQGMRDEGQGMRDEGQGMRDEGQGTGSNSAIRNPQSAIRNPQSVFWCVAVTFVLLLLANCASGSPYQEYQVVLLPPAALLAAGAMERLYRRLESALARQFWWVLVIVVGGVLPALPLSDQILRLPAQFPDQRGTGPLGKLEEVARFVQEHTAPDAEIFTFQPFVAIEARRRLTPGAELAAFGYKGNWPEAQARRFHVLNDSLVKQYFTTRRPALVLLSGGDVTLLGGQADEKKDRLELTGPILQALTRHYELARTFDEAGQFYERFYVFLPRGRSEG